MGIEPRYLMACVSPTKPRSKSSRWFCADGNKRLRVLLAAGVDALGMSGVDRGLVRRKMQNSIQDMGLPAQLQPFGDILPPLLNKDSAP
jgi:hypothetical protein